jgi:hypothetical protein
MNRFLIFVLCFLAIGCDRKNKSSDINVPIPEEIIDRGDLYCNLAAPAYEEKKYVHSKCDGAGFTSLFSLRCPNVDLSVFEDANGKPYRSPTKDCFKNGESKAEFSRDMLLMRMIAAWKHKDIEWVNRFINFARDNDWVMCKAIDPFYTAGRCVVGTLSELLIDMQSKLEGQSASFRSQLVQSDADAIGLKSDYEAHLDVLRIWLEGEIYGGITDGQKSRLKGYADRESKNALYLAVSSKYHGGDFTNVYTVLQSWPSDRLPGSQDWCTEYLHQRDMLKSGQPNPDWLPCDRKEIHSGTDYNFVLHILGY